MSAGDQHAVEALQQFLFELCNTGDDEDFVRRLARTTARWTTVQDLLPQQARAELDRIAFRSAIGGFSPGNLKAHYVLDEDFVNDGSAFVLFALVGSDWTYVIRASNQNRFTSASLWLAGEDL